MEFFKKVILNNGEEYTITKGCIMMTTRDSIHGDIKTVIAKKIPPVPAFTEVKVLGWFRNFYGTWITVEYNDMKYDLNPQDLVYVRASE